MEATLPVEIGPLSRSLKLRPAQVEAVVRLLDDGNTVPFITRYRRDQTGGLDEERIREVQAEVRRLRQLAERKQTILRSIDSQGKLTPELAGRIEAAQTAKQLEDLYLPYRPQKQTLATAARERGLAPLAEEVLSATVSAEGLDARAAEFVNPDKGLKSIADVLLGVGHILAEQMSERADVRSVLRRIFWQSGQLCSSAVEPEVKAEPESTVHAPESTLHAPREEEGITRSVMSTVSQEEQAEAVAETVETNVEAAEASAESEANVAPEAAAEREASTTTDAAAESATDAPALAHTTEEKPPDAKQPAEKKKGKRAEAKKVEKRQKQKREAKQFRDYFDFRQAVEKAPPHRILAINRGERAKILRVRIEADTEAMSREAEQLLVPADHPHADFLRGCARDALSRLVLPGLEREVRRQLTDEAEEHAVRVFARNLRSLLLQPPVRDRRILAIDPGFKHGCKLAAIDPFGRLLGHVIIHLVGKEERRRDARAKLVELVREHQIQVIAIGNGTGCREAEQLVSEILADELKAEAESGALAYVMVNEAGASVYSTSQLGREEFPDYDATLRGSISIARRLQDPLSELAKIEPASIGVGLYQHDVKVRHLGTSLDDVVESCVNYVGVELNTASTALLRYVSGLNQLTARRLYEFRHANGPFHSRAQLKEVPGFGEATFVQAAGFLKITGGENPLDATWIHPESYEVAQRVLERLLPNGIAGAANEVVGAPNQVARATPQTDAASEESVAGAMPQTVACIDEAMPTTTPTEVRSPDSTCQNVFGPELAAKISALDVAALAAELGVGELSLRDILAQLSRPGRDPRETLPPPIFKRGVLKIDDLTEGMELNGTVLNVVDFGAFIDIGLHDSALVHVSRMANRFIRDPNEVLAIGEVVRVWVTGIDKARRRVSLTMIAPGTDRPPARRERRPSRAARPTVGAEQGAAAEGTATAIEGAPQTGAPRRPRRDRPQRPAVATGVAGATPQSAGSPPQGAHGGQNRGGYNRSSQGSGPPARSRPPAKPKPLVPITKAMLKGKEPMRTFGDLLQFVKQKETTENPPEATPPKEPPTAP